jgi:1-acyl-sn-glycerol-3-phosphate acyltransferase
MSLVYRVEIIGLENYATAQPKILCPNHINYLDPVVIGSYLPEFVRFMAKKEIFSNRLFHWFFTTCGGFPVDRQGNDIGAVKTTIRILKNSESVLIFAEGTRNPGLTPLPAKPGVAMIAHRAAVPIQPITVDSTYKLFSKIRVIFHPIVWLQFTEKPSVHDYESAVAGILTTIYDAITLYKGRDLS